MCVCARMHMCMCVKCAYVCVSGCMIQCFLATRDMYIVYIYTHIYIWWVVIYTYKCTWWVVSYIHIGLHLKISCLNRHMSLLGFAVKVILTDKFWKQDFHVNTLFNFVRVLQLKREVIHILVYIETRHTCAEIWPIYIPSSGENKRTIGRLKVD